MLVESCRAVVEARCFPDSGEESASSSPAFKASDLASFTPATLGVGSARPRTSLTEEASEAAWSDAPVETERGRISVRDIPGSARPDRVRALVATRPRRGLKRCVRLLWPSEEALYGGAGPRSGGGQSGIAFTGLGACVNHLQ